MYTMSLNDETKTEAYQSHRYVTSVIDITEPDVLGIIPVNCKLLILKVYNS